MSSNTHKAIGAAASIAIFGALAYLGYRVAKQINDIDIDWENLDDVYHNRAAKDHEGS